MFDRSPLFARYLLGLFFKPEVEKRMFLRNVGELLPDCTVLHPEDNAVLSHHSGSLQPSNLGFTLCDLQFGFR
jgi:hypothetical protein